MPTITIIIKTKKMATQKLMTKQQMLDKTPENNNEVILQSMLHSMSKTRLEQIKRVFQEVNNSILFKTQYRQMPFIEVLEAIQKAVELNKTESNE